MNILLMILKKWTFAMIKKKNGFTLLEIVVVVCLIGIVSAISAPGLMRAIPGVALKSAANDLLSDMRFARSLAVRNQENVTITFDLVGGSYTISTVVLPPGAGLDPIKTVNLSNYRGGIRFGVGEASVTADTPPITIPGGFLFANFGGGDSVTFTRNGMCANLGYVYLCNENSDISYAAVLSSLAGVVILRKTSGPLKWNTI